MSVRSLLINGTTFSLFSSIGFFAFFTSADGQSNFKQTASLTRDNQPGSPSVPALLLRLTRQINRVKIQHRLGRFPSPTPWRTALMNQSDASQSAYRVLPSELSVLFTCPRFKRASAMCRKVSAQSVVPAFWLPKRKYSFLFLIGVVIDIKLNSV